MSAGRDDSYHANAAAGELLELAPVGALERYRLPAAWLPAAPTGQTCLLYLLANSSMVSLQNASVSPCGVLQFR